MDEIQVAEYKINLFNNQLPSEELLNSIFLNEDFYNKDAILKLFSIKSLSYDTKTFEEWADLYENLIPYIANYLKVEYSENEQELLKYFSIFSLMKIDLLFSREDLISKLQNLITFTPETEGFQYIQNKLKLLLLNLYTLNSNNSMHNNLIDLLNDIKQNLENIKNLEKIIMEKYGLWR